MVVPPEAESGSLQTGHSQSCSSHYRKNKISVQKAKGSLK